MVFLHTRNRDTLFKKVVPVWLHELLYPLPFVPAVTMSTFGLPARNRCIVKHTSSILLGLKKPKWSWFSTSSSIREDKGAVSACSSPLYSDTFEAIPNDSRTINTIAQKIADTDRLLESGLRYDFAARELIYSAVHLNSLKDTLEDIGFYEHEVWRELDMTYEILIKAINIKSRVALVVRVDDRVH